jgi:hypothetical protein
MMGNFNDDTGDGGGGDARPSLDDVRFDTIGYALQGEPDPGQARVWHTPEGDGLGVYLLNDPPTLPADAASVDELAALYQRLVEPSGGRVVEFGVVSAGGCAAVRTLVSVRQQPSGRACLASLTLPFRDFSYVVKCQCMEVGLTGLKEAVLFDRSRAANELIQAEDGQFHIPGWNPDDPRHDVEFPNHPVARARRVLAHLAATLSVADRVRRLPGFALPQHGA